MDSDITPATQEEQSQELPTKPSGSKRKFASQAQFESLQSTVADMRNEMATLISLFKDSVSPPKKPCLDGGSQSTSHPMMAISPNENQFLDQPNGNQFALTSCGDQFSATQIPSGSFDLGLAMPMAPNPTSPMAHSHISSESAEGSFVPTYRNVEGGVLNASTQAYRRRDLLKTAIHPRFHSLCSTKTPITAYLFGDNMLETAKTISSSQKMTRSLASNRPPSSSVSRSPFRSQYPLNRPQQSSAVSLNYRGHSNNTWRSRHQNRQAPQPQPSFLKKHSGQK